MKAPTSWRGGSLAANLSLAVAKASAAEIAAGAIDTKGITPLGLYNSCATVASPTGYIKLMRGFTLQWGTATAVGNTTTTVTLPSTFPSLCVFAAVEGGIVDNDAHDNNPFIAGRGVNSISIFSARDESTSVNWLALGF